MKHKHTPGPWEISGNVSHYDLDVDGERVSWCSTVFAYMPYTAHSEDASTPDTMHDFQRSAVAYGRTKAEANANARLIAAAPELLEALEHAVARVEIANAEGNPILSAWIDGARAAIHKATME